MICTVGNQFYWRHKWSAWKMISDENITRTGETGVVGNRIVQQRKCERCDKIEIEKETVWI